MSANLYGRGLVADHKPRSRGPLNDRFLMSPYSTWNTREGFWQDRKRRWLNFCGIKSEAGRAEALTYNIPMVLSDGRTGNKVASQTSVFDPVLTELAYSWWCPKGGVVLDPFAGGSVRGIVASVLGLRYWGVELREDQVAANVAQLNESNTGQYRPKWNVGDAGVMVPRAPMADMIFSCPPYGNLEVYSDDPRDISNMTYQEFLVPYRQIIAAAASRLRDDRFAVWVVANYRDKDNTGRHMLDFVGDTIRAFEDAGLMFYNDVILINAVGSGAMRANTSFLRGNGKIVKLHQNVLVFVKGDPAKAPLPCRPPEENANDMATG